MLQKFSNKGIGKIIALIALVFLGKAYTNRYEAMDYEDITYKFVSIYPDIKTMDIIENQHTKIKKEQ
jgi:hypothetical protein